jgi:hypothetical protein
MSKIVVAFIGPAGSGKSEAAKYIDRAFGFERTRFANPLKNMLKLGLGLTHEQVDGDQKEVPTDKLCGRTPRHAMKTLGTEWGRDQIHPDLWAEAWYNTLPNVPRVSVDDMRFPNEHKLVKKRMRGTVIRIQRAGYEYDPCHPSEAHQLEPDYIVYNPPELSVFFDRLEHLLSAILVPQGDFLPFEGVEKVG